MVSEQDIAQAAQVVRSGGLVGMPTETVYGLACDATHGTAVARVFEAKARPSFDPLIVHVLDRDMARGLTDAPWPAEALRLAEAFWPGPLTLVLPRKAGAVADLATSGLDTVALRAPAHPVARALIASAGVPLAAPSANRFGSISPTRAEHVRQELGDAVSLVLDGGACVHGLESTVVGFDAAGHPAVLRLGALTTESLAGVLGELPEVRSSGSRPASPGMLDRHYAPRTPMRLFEAWDDAADVARIISEEPDRSVGLLAPGLADDSAGRSADRSAGFVASHRLRQGSDLRASAAGLFAAMRALDAADLTDLMAVAVEDAGLGRAINDRLRRASLPVA
ncbi:MAG: L-threonylcarbamoyladenylate synthase [Planctomycetota bacterium]